MTETPAQGSIRSFREGLFTPSLLAVVTAVIVLIAEIIAMTAMVTPAWFARGGYRYFMLDVEDQGPYTTAQALSLNRAGAVPSVIVVCASATQSSLSSPDELEAHLTAAAGRDVAVYMLCLDGMTPWEMLALADQVPEQFNGIAVIDIGLNRFSRDDDDLQRVLRGGRLGFRSEIAEAEMRKAGGTLPQPQGMFLFDNAGFFSLRMLALPQRIVLGPIDHRANHRFRPDRLMEEVRYREQVMKVREIQSSFVTGSEANLEVLSRTVKLLQERGARVVLVEAPVNPRFLREDMDPVEFESRMDVLREYGRGLGLEILTPARDANFQQADFFDWAHVRSPDARQRYTAALGTRLGAMLQQPSQSGNAAATPVQEAR